eukprot:scaffold33204_cov46-Phaeocystis_antarctica.AAC.1
MDFLTMVYLTMVPLIVALLTMALLTRCGVSTQPCHCCSPLRIGGGAPAEVHRRPPPFPL